MRFAGVVENIYTFEGEPGHEILLLYEAEFADPALYEQEVLAGVEAEPKTGVWRDLSGPDGGLPLYPPGLAEIVAQLGSRGQPLVLGRTPPATAAALPHAKWQGSIVNPCSARANTASDQRNP